MADRQDKVMVEASLAQEEGISLPQMGPQWTAEQQDAIHTRGCDILVAAGAGAGKTAVLVERVIQGILQENGLDIERLLVVTFTEAAAAEMRERIRSALERKLQEEPGSARLQLQLARLPLASISTIHSFCSRLLRRYFYHLGLDPAFRIITDAEAGLMKSEIMDELLAGYYQAGDREVLDFIDAYGGKDGDEEVRRLILRLYDFQMSLADPQKWQQEVMMAFEPHCLLSIIDSPLFHEAGRQLLMKLHQVIRKLQAALEICSLPNGPAGYAERLQEEKAVLEELAEALRQQQWDKVWTWAYTFERLPSISRKSDVDEVLKEECRKLRDDAKKQFKELTAKLLSRSEAQVAGEMKRLAPTVHLLFRLVNEFSAAYNRVKHSQGVVDFADLEHLTLQLLTLPSEGGKLRPSPVALQVQEKFDEILIDEYQDTNGVQDCILSLVAGAWDREPGGVPRFMVGDIKQSIYGFRLTDPGLFLSKYHRFSTTSGAVQRRIDLSTNFRCRREVIWGVNFIFRQLMTADIAGISYDEKAELKYGADYPELIPQMVEAAAAEDPDSDLAPRCIEVYLLDSKLQGEARQTSGGEAGEAGEDILQDPDSQPAEDDLDELERLEREARVMAQRIRRMVDGNSGESSGSGARGSGNPVLVWDKSLKSYRPVEYRDIVVLLRSVKNRANQVLEVFRRAGIPAYAQLDSGYFAAVEVKLMMALLQVLDNPQQDIPLAAVLRAPWFAVTDEELAQIRLGAPNGGFYQAVEKAAQRGDRLGHKLRNALDSLDKWRTAARRMPLSELIGFLYRETGFYDYAGSMPKGEQRQANLRGLQERAREFDGFTGRGLSRFVRFLERLQAEDELGEVRPIGEGENVVRIMSMHRSKGLEFPIVFLADLGKSFSLNDLRSDVLFHKDLGVGLAIIDPDKRCRYDTFSHQVIKDRLKQDLLAEEMRILYVAMTRAREQLILVGTSRDLAKAALKWAGAVSQGWALPSDVLVSAQSYLDWLGPALIRHRDGEALRAAAGKTEEERAVTLLDDPSRWYVWLQGRSPTLEWMEASWQGQEEDSIPWREIQQLMPLSTSPLDDKLRQEFADRLLWRYPKDQVVNLPAKVSVTEIKQWTVPDREILESELPAWSAGRGFHHSDRRGVRRPRFILAEKDRVSAVEAGIWTHTVLQHLDLTKNLADMEVLESEARRLTAEGYLREEHLSAVAFDSIVRFFQSPLGHRLLQQPDNVRREVSFTLAVPAAEVYQVWDKDMEGETIVVQGVVDCLVREPAGFLLVDFKTDRISRAGAEKAARSYEVQVDYYCRAVERIFGQPVKEAYLYFLQAGAAVRMH